jgi:hypothetical protein
VAREEALYREILTGSAPASSRRRDGRP